MAKRRTESKNGNSQPRRSPAPASRNGPARESVGGARSRASAASRGVRGPAKAGPSGHDRASSSSATPATGRSPVVFVLVLLFAAGGVLALFLLAGQPARDRTAAAGEATADAPAPAADEAAFDFPPDAYVPLSRPTCPRTAYALRREDGRVLLAVAIDGYEAEASDVRFDLGLAAAKPVRLGPEDAVRSSTAGKRRQWFFAVPTDRLAPADGRVDRLRMGLAVAWAGANGGPDRQRERFRHLDRRATHAPLAEDPRDWAVLDLAAYEQQLADRRDRVFVPVDQPLDGKLTVVIDDPDGDRIRNVIAGVRRAKGPQEVEWDCCDEDSRLVKPGTYTWRAISHAGIEPEFLFNWCNGNSRDLTRNKLSNHGFFSAATSNDRYVFLGARITEGGWSLLALDHDGAFRHGYGRLHGTGLGEVLLAADETYLYVAKDGIAWGQKVDKRKPDWTLQVNLSISRFDIERSRPVPFPKRGRDVKYDTYPYGPGADKPGTTLSLAGFAVHAGTLYIASRWREAVIRVDAATGKEQGEIPLPGPGPLAVHEDELLAVSKGAVVSRSLKEDKTTDWRERVPSEPGREIQGLACDARGRIFLADAGSHTVRVFTPDGAPTDVFGREPGGLYAGPFVPERMIRPCGIAVFEDRLWVTQETTTPKRIVAWDLAPKRVAVQLFGNPPYGGPGAGFDPQDKTRWIGQEALWRLDFENKTATCTHVPKKHKGHLGGAIGPRRAYHFVRHEGRTFLLGTGIHLHLISELMPDQTIRDLALLSSAHAFLYALGWKRVAIFGDKQGTINLLRSYWSNTATGLVNDVPGEVMLAPRMWGTIEFK